MKRIIALILCISIVLTGCRENSNVDEESARETQMSTSESADESLLAYTKLDDENLLCYVEDAIYTELIETLDQDMYYIEGVSTSYVSTEYLEELEYNSQSNIFFGYSLAELEEMFQGSQYVFTLGEDDQTIVQELVEIEDGTFDKIIKNVAIGSGVILISVTVAIITKNPAASVTAGKTVKMIFTASSMGAKAGTIMALESAGLGGVAAAVAEAIRTGDWERAVEASLVGASEGFKFGAIFGTVKGIANGIKVVGNTRYFPDGSEQALKYPEGVEFTKAVDGSAYPRFEKWAKATARFDAPTIETALNHTGLSGTYYWDAKLANAQCGFAQTPAGYVWHHVEDMKTMILIPQDIHSVAMGGMSHTGGASLIREFLGLK